MQFLKDMAAANGHVEVIEMIMKEMENRKFD